MREKEEGAVKMQDITATIFSQVLHYIYTGECRLTAENTEEMLAAADRVCIPTFIVGIVSKVYLFLP